MRHGRVYTGKRGWTQAYRRWLTTVRFDHPAQQIVLQDYIHAVSDGEARLARLEQQIEDLLPSWSMAPVVEAVQAMRGVGLVVAVTVVAGAGDVPACRPGRPKVGLDMPDLRCDAAADRDFSRFANPRQLMAYLGLVPSEHSSGQSVRRGGITKAGSALARRVLIEGAQRLRGDLSHAGAGQPKALGSD